MLPIFSGLHKELDIKSTKLVSCSNYGGLHVLLSVVYQSDHLLHKRNLLFYIMYLHIFYIYESPKCKMNNPYSLKKAKFSLLL